MVKKYTFCIILVVLTFVIFGAKSLPVKADYCGTPSGFGATISINAKKCEIQWDASYICNNNGPWICNGNYSCAGGDLGTDCASGGGYPDNCEVVVGSVSQDEHGWTGCDITNGGFSCDRTKDTQTGSCMVTGNPPPPPPPPAPPGCDFTACGGDGSHSCGSDNRYVSGSCSSYSWFSGDGCYYDSSCVNTPPPPGPPPPPPPPPGPVNQLPTGYHDAYSGSQSLAFCRAAGWATDPDNTNTDLSVRIFSDRVPSSTPIAVVSAGAYRCDLSNNVCPGPPPFNGANVCPGGTCAFDVDISGLITGGQPHRIEVEAQDAQNPPGTWVPLSNTPKTITCACSTPVNPTITEPIPQNHTYSCDQGDITIRWNPVAGSTYAVRINEVAVGAGDLTSWKGNCTPPQIDVNDVCVDNRVENFYTFTPTAGKDYVYWIHAVNGCGTWSSFPTHYRISLPVSSVNVTPAVTSGLQINTPVTLTAQIFPGPGPVNSATFYKDSDTPPGTITLGAPNPDPTFPYQNTVTAGPIAGNASVGANVNSNVWGFLCSDKTPATIGVTASAAAWWQVRGGDVTSNLNLSSIIPATCTLASGCTANFNLGNGQGFPGVNSYNSGTAAYFGVGSPGPGGKSWLTNTNAKLGKKFGYDYFNGQLPADVVSGTIPITVNNPTLAVFAGGSTVRGYAWFSYDGATLGDLTLPAINFNGRKAVLLVKNANVNINGRITLQNNGSDFFMLVAGKTAAGTKGDINISSGVTSANDTDYGLEGLYVAEGSIHTGGGAGRFVGRGSFVSYGDLKFERKNAGAANNTVAYDFFDYGPEILMNFPSVLTDKQVKWEEVAP